MKASAFQKLGEQVARALDNGYKVKGPLVYELVGQHEILRGIYFEGSSFASEAFYVWVFYLPLFVPAATVSFNMGHRLRRDGGGDRWQAGQDSQGGEIARVLLSDELFRCSIASVHEFIALIKERFDLSDIYVSQALACSLARAEGDESLRNVVSALERRIDRQVPWQVDILERVTALQDAGGDERQTLLNDWKRDTIKNLRLEV